MAASDVETYHTKDDGKWRNKVHGNEQASSVHDTKAEAVARGRELAIANKSEHIIKNEDGRIAEKNSYGNDPRNIPG